MNEDLTNSFKTEVLKQVTVGKQPRDWWETNGKRLIQTAKEPLEKTLVKELRN